MRRTQRFRFAGELFIALLFLLIFRLTSPSPRNSENDNDWSRFAYVQFVTQPDYVCHSVMLFETLHRLGSQPDRLMLVTSFLAEQNSWVLDLVLKARDEYGVRIKLIEAQPKRDGFKWGQSFTKLLAFNQTQYDRVLSLDPDSTLLKPMDELFRLPSTPVAMPRGYWLSTPHTLTSAVLLVEPSIDESERIVSAIEVAQPGEFDTEVLNTLYNKTALVLPHRPYVLATGEFRSKKHNHTTYLGNDFEDWDAEKVFDQAKFVHFADQLMPKPWVSAPDRYMEQKQPECVVDDISGVENCRDREIWLELYKDFKERRKRICGLNNRHAKPLSDGSFA